MPSWPESITAGQTGHLGHHQDIHQALNTFIFVRDYGPIATDLSADTSAVVNAALSAVPAGGATVILPPGRLRADTPYVVAKHGTKLVGAGPGQRQGATQDAIGTRIEAGAGFTGGEIVQVQTAAGTEPVYGVTLRDFTIDGKLVGSGVDGILFRCNRGLIDNVHVHKCTGDGFILRGIASPAWDTYDTTLRTVHAGDNGGAGVLLDTDAADTHLRGCILYNNGDSIIIRSSSAQITACHLYDATRYNVFFDGGGSRTKILGCKIEGAGQHGINIDSTNGGYSTIQIIGNGISSNGDSANNTFDNVIIQGPSGNGVGRTQIVSNAIGVKSGVSNKARYGVNLASTAAQNTQVADNVFDAASAFGTAAVNNAGSSSLLPIIRHNINWVTEASGTVAVASGSTTATVTHGLSVTPAAKDIRLNFAADPLAANKLWASGFTSTQFTVNVGTAPGGAGTTVAWEAQVL